MPDGHARTSCETELRRLYRSIQKGECLVEDEPCLGSKVVLTAAHLPGVGEEVATRQVRHQQVVRASR